MQLGVIGNGKIVKEFLPYIIKIDGIEVVGIMNRPASLPKAQELCDRLGILHAVTSLEELKALGADTVYVAVPNHLHFAYCMQAMELGLNVIVEKPMTISLAETKQLSDYAKAHDLFLYEAITTMYMESFAKMKEWLSRIGKIKIASLNFSQYSSRYEDFENGIIHPVYDATKGGGALMDINIYNIYLLVGLFGRPLSACYFPNIEKGVDTSGMLILQYDGFTCNCIGSKACDGPADYVIEGVDGFMTVDRSPNKMGGAKLVLRNGESESFTDTMADKRVIPEFEAFRDAIECKDYADRDSHLEDSLIVAEILDQGRRAVCK